LTSQSAIADQERLADRRRLRLWHAGCALTAVIMVTLGHFFGGLVGPPGLVVKAGLLIMALPGLAGLFLLQANRHRDQVLVLGIWCVAATCASALSGGLAGPLSGLLFLPLAAGLMLGGVRWGMNGALIGLGSLMASAAVGWASVRLSGSTPQASGLAAIGGLVAAAAFFAALTWTWRPREQALSASRTARQRALALLNNTPGLTLEMTSKGRVLSTYGTPPPALDSRALLDHGLLAAVHAPDRPELLSILSKAAAASEGSESLQIAFSPRQALDRRVLLIVRRMDPSGSCDHLIAQAFDGTSQFAREHELEMARAEAVARNEGKSRFLANMSHELRTPLNAVLGFSDIMRTRLFGPLPDRYAEYADSIHQAGGHLLALINDVLDVSKIEAERYELSVETFDAREAVSASVALVRLSATNKGVFLSAVLPADTVTVDADRRALQQITLNLLSNAIKFTPSAGSVTATLEAIGPYLELIVSDTGLGIAPEDLKRLGKPYEQAGGVDQRAQGTGLGLSLARSLSELHGGRMTIDSTLGEGTAVTVRLPVVTIQKALSLDGGSDIIPLTAASDIKG